MLVNNRGIEKFIKFIGVIGVEQEDRHLMYDGVSLLDEAIIQNRADNMLFGGLSFNSNFDYYGEFQIASFNFGRILKGNWEVR